MFTVLLLAAMQSTAEIPAQSQTVPLTRIHTASRQEVIARAVESPPDPVLVWNETALRAIKADKTPPPMAARNLAMVHAAIYDAVNSVTGTHEPFRVEGKPCGCTSPEAAASVAAHRVLLDLYPRQEECFNAALRCTLVDIPDGEAKRAGVELGQCVAEKVLAWRERDGASARTAYRPRHGPGWWEPTLPGYKPALLPGWSRVKCFAIRSSDQFRPQEQPSLQSQEYTAAFLEVKELGGMDSRVRTRDQTEIAYFWEDGVGTVTPPGHWNRIAQTVAREHGNTLEDNARLFALLNVALADAGIACWDCKFKFEFWRPVQAIREADTDANPDTAPDRCWAPLLETPPFPSYTSGHSTFSGAASAVLACFYNTDAVRFTSTSERLPGVTRAFKSFSAAAEEAGQSRIYGGIHWQFDNVEGLHCGRQVGEYVCANFLRPRKGRPAVQPGPPDVRLLPPVEMDLKPASRR